MCWSAGTESGSKRVPQWRVCLNMTRLTQLRLTSVYEQCSRSAYGFSQGSGGHLLLWNHILLHHSAQTQHGETHMHSINVLFSDYTKPYRVHMCIFLTSHPKRGRNCRSSADFWQACESKFRKDDAIHCIHQPWSSIRSWTSLNVLITHAFGFRNLVARYEKREVKCMHCSRELSVRMSSGQHNASTESMELCKQDPT